MADGFPISAGRLKSFIERIERLIEERQGIQGDIKDVFSEAKGVGYDVTTMRKVIQIRAMDPADRAERESLLDTYLHALGTVDRIEARLEAGDSVRAAAEATGASKSTVHRVSQKRENSKNGTAKLEVITPPEAVSLPLAREINPGEGAAGTAKPDGQAAPLGSSIGSSQKAEVDLPGDHAGDRSEPSAPVPQGVNADPPPDRGTTVAHRENGQGAHSGTLFERITGAFPKAAPEDDLQIPAFLRRVPA